MLLNLRGGGLQIHGVDIMIPGQACRGIPAPAPRRPLASAPARRLELTDCTITVAGRPPLPRPSSSSRRGAETGTDQVFPRSSSSPTASSDRPGDCVTAGSGRLLDLQLKNVLVSTEGSLLHALGSSQIEGPGPRLKATIARSLVCVAGQGWCTSRARSRNPNCR